VALIVDGEEADIVKVALDSHSKSQFWDSRLPNHGSAPSSIHNISSSNSDAAMSDESSVLESISGRTRDRILASDNNTAGRKVQSPELWKLPDDKFDDGDPACSFVDFEDVHLNETLKSLMETKTPMLPSRLRSAVNPQQFSRPATFVEPRKVPTHHVGPGSIPASTHDDVHFALSERLSYAGECDPGQLAKHSHAKQSIDTDNQSDANADFKASTVREFPNASYREFSEKYPVQSKHRRSVDLPVSQSHIEAVDRKGHNMAGKSSSPSGVYSLPSELSSNVESSAVKSSVPAAAAAESELLEYSAPSTDVVASPLLIVSDTDSLDSLIARYKNLRDCSTVDSRMSQSLAESKPVSYVENVVPSSMLNLTASSIGGTLKTVDQTSLTTAGTCILQPTVVAPHLLQQSFYNVDQADRAAADDVEGDLCNDSFNDIRLSLQNVSVDSAHTPVHASLQQKGGCYDFKLCSANMLNLQPEYLCPCWPWA